MRKTNTLARRGQSPDDARMTIEVLGGGSGRGLRGLLGPISDWNRQSDRTTIALRPIDPVPGRAHAITTEASARGIKARSEEARVEDLLRDEGDAERSPVYLALDDPKSDATALDVLSDRRRPVLGGLLVRTPWEELLGMRWTITAEDRENKQLGAKFFRKLSEVVARRGSTYVVGERGRAEHAAAEPQYRAWLGRAATTNVGRIAVGVEPEVLAPFTITVDGGRTTQPLLLKDRSHGWADPLDLAADLVTNPATPVILLKGENFSVGEIGPDGIRIHQVRLRTDGRLSLRGAAAIDLETMRAAEAERMRREAEAQMRAFREELEREAEARRAEFREQLRSIAAAVLAQAVRQSITRQQAAFTTD